MYKREFLETTKSFLIPLEAYYAESIEEKRPHILIGFYLENGGTDGEFEILWDDSVGGMKLMAYDDAWEALSKMPELIELMAKTGSEELKYSVNEFAAELLKLGYKDITQRTNPYV